LEKLFNMWPHDFYSKIRTQNDVVSKTGHGESISLFRHFQYTANPFPATLTKVLVCLIAVALFYSTSFANESEMFDLINAERAKHGLHPLNYNETLSNSARLHSRDMAEQDFFAHQSPSGSTPASRASRAGYQWAAVGETLFVGSTSAQRAISSLMASLSHRNVVLSPEFCDVGIGLVVEKNSTYQAYWTQVFGRQQNVGRCTASNTNPPETLPPAEDASSGGGCFISILKNGSPRPGQR
jgi:uncharacterized protein YkwD